MEYVIVDIKQNKRAIILRRKPPNIARNNTQNDIHTSFSHTRRRTRNELETYFCAPYTPLCVTFAFLVRSFCVLMRSMSACVRRCQPMCVGAHEKFKVRPKNFRRTERTECSNLCVPCQLCSFCIRPVYFLYPLDVRYSSVTTR